MCVIFFYVNSNPEPNYGYKLILASNRDEFFNRETKPAFKWNSAVPIYGGMDMKSGREGGTWLAISGKDNTIKVGALLNLTGEPYSRNAFPINSATVSHNLTANNTNDSLLGRGMIVANYVSNFNDDNTSTNYNKNLVADCTKYNAFNFVSLEIGSSRKAQITICSNAPPHLVQYPENACYGFSNSLPKMPFEKVRNGRDRFQKIVDEWLSTNEKRTNYHNEPLIAKLLELLKCKQKFWPDDELKRRAPTMGEYLSALNVRIPHEKYGSRTHTVILVDSHNKMDFIEETMLADCSNDDKWSYKHLVEQFF